MEVNTLYHHGIPGQRWGVRRYQREDGSRTSAGKRNREVNEEAAKDPVNKKSNYRKKLEEKYVNKGLTPENAAIAANNKIRTQKILGTVAGVTVAAAAAAATTYAIRKYVKEGRDQVIKVGDKMQRIEGQKTIFGSKNRNLHDAFYATNNIYDNKNYEAAFGYQKKHLYGKAYKLDIEATSNIKIASQRKARDTLRDLIREHPEYGRVAKNNPELSKHIYGYFDSDLRNQHRIPKADIDRFLSGKKVSNRLMQKIYDNFNSNLVGKPDELDKYIRPQFYNMLKQQGYSGIQDINDLKWSKLRGKNPLIIFDKSKVRVNKVEDIVDKVSLKGHEDAYAKMAKLVGKQSITKAIPAYAAITIPTTVTSTIIANKIIDKTIVNKAVVKQYKKEHPNTKLSDKQIAEMLNGGK